MVKIPSRLEDLLPLGAFERVLDALHQPELSQKVREAVSKVGLKEVNPLEKVQEAWQQAKSWLGTLSGEEAPVSSQIINATGALFRQDTDVLPLATTVGLSFAKAASAFLDGQHGEGRSSGIVSNCIGCSHHVWMSEPLLALHVAVKAVSPGGVLIPRADCVRIPGLGELQAALQCLGTSITEVGAANGASAQDWHAALKEAPLKAIVTCSLNGMSAEQQAESRKQLLAAAAEHGTTVIELLVDGTADRRASQQYGFPLIYDYAQQARHVVLLPMHLLMGGVRGVLCWGDHDTVQTMRRLAKSLGAELNAPAVSANLLALQMACLEDDLERGVVGMLRTHPENLRNRCQRLATQLAGLGPVLSADVVDSHHALGCSPWDRYRLSNSVVKVALAGNLEPIVQKIRRGSSEVSPVDVKQSGDSLVIDLRFVHPDDDHRIVMAFQNLLPSTSNPPNPE